MKSVLKLGLNAMVFALFAFVLGIPTLFGAVGGVVGGVLLSGMMPQGLCSGVLTEVWTGEMIKKLRSGDTATWLDGLPDYSAYAENDVIHLVDVGADPDVLINNTTYPIAVQDLTDLDKAFSLDKFQTKVTPVTDDELYALSYDKMGSVKERHGQAILEAKFKKAAHALAPQADTATTPVLFTTGANESGRRRMTREDIVRLKGKFDAMQIPTDGRRLVLCSDHVNDLLMQDQKFAEQYYNYTTGKIANLYGFQVYEFINNPYYSAAGAKLALDATKRATDRQASFAFYDKRTFKASGTTKMYYRESATNPEYQRNEINFRHMFIVLPKKQEAIAAICSGAYTPAISVAPTSLNFAVAGGTKVVQVSATSDYAFNNVDGFTITKQGNVLQVIATDNSAGAAAKNGTITLTLAEDITKTATITLTQPKTVG